MRNLFAITTLFPLLCLGGCIGFPLGKDFTREAANGQVVDVSRERVCGKRGMIHLGMTREAVAELAADLELESRAIDPFRVAFWVSGWQMMWYLVSPEGGGTRKYFAGYEIFVDFNAEGRVVGCHTENRPPNTWDRKEDWIPAPVRSNVVPPENPGISN